MKSLFKVVLGCIFSLMVMSEACALGAGAYSSTAVSPTIYSKNVNYMSSFSPLGPFPTGSKVGAWIKWNYSVSFRPVGFQALLCWDNTMQDCFDITSSNTGTTTHFNGKDPKHTFVMVRRVITKGIFFMPLYGTTDQIIVNFTY